MKSGSLNPAQKEAVNSTASKILCLAGAGTGKTHTMIARIKRLVADGVDPLSILVLTFTNAAAFEMKCRYENDALPGPTPEFRTFHSFCYHLICTDSAVLSKLGYKKVPNLATPEEIKRIETSVKLQCNIKLSEAKLSGSAVLSMKEEKELEIYQKALKKAITSANLITFDTMCYSVCELFATNNEIILKYKDRFKYIFVDEFQDTDPKQYKFVSSFTNSDLLVVGDALQSLYSFRGADSTIIKSLAENSDWTTIRLKENYRSTKQICNYANAHSKYASDTYRIPIEATREGDEVKELKTECRNRSDVSSESISLAVRSFDIQDKTTAFLCRTNAEVQSVLETLHELDLPCFTQASQDVSGKILQALIDPIFCMDWLSSYLNAEDYAMYLRNVQLNPDYNLDNLTTDFKNNMKIAENVTKMTDVKLALNSDNRASACLRIIEILGIQQPEVDDTIYNFTDDTQVLEYVKKLYESSPEVADGIYVGTVHSSKGLEYDNVAVFNVGGPSFPLTNEENNNIFYVAVTRAKSNLIVFRSKW